MSLKISPEHKDWSSGLDPEPPHTKGEHEETKITIKVEEDDEEEPQVSQTEPEADGATGSDPAFPSCSVARRENFSGPETGDGGGGWKETTELHFGLNSVERGAGAGVGKKPFLCSECGKRFTRNSHLKIHTRIHTGEKPYSCSLCTKRFSRSDTLKIHMKIHSPINPPTCRISNRKCASAHPGGQQGVGPRQLNQRAQQRRGLEGGDLSTFTGVPAKRMMKNLRSHKLIRPK